MGTGASSVERHQSTTSIVSDELRDPKSVMFKNARAGNERDLTLVLQQGMDPNERESQFSGWVYIVALFIRKKESSIKWALGVFAAPWCVFLIFFHKILE